MPGSTPLLMLLPHVRLVNVTHGEGTRAQMAAQRVSHVWVHETNVIFQCGLVRVFLPTVGASSTLGNMGNHSSCHFSGPQVTCNQQPVEVSMEASGQQKHTGGQCLPTHSPGSLCVVTKWHPSHSGSRSPILGALACAKMKLIGY